MSNILYKYIDINGAKCMIGNSNLQFTNASQLNDPFDCHPNLIDYSNIPDQMTNGWIPKEWLKEKEENDALNLRNDTWLCSLSKVHDSLLMWSHYCYNHHGLCIGLDIDKVKECTPPLLGFIQASIVELEVQYQDILKRPDCSHLGIIAWHYQLATKAKAWEYEQEVRLIIEKPSPHLAALTSDQAKRSKHKETLDWKEIHHYIKLTGECFNSIYFGINADAAEKEKIVNFAQTKLNPNIKIYQMQVDESAFLLKPILE